MTPKELPSGKDTGKISEVFSKVIKNLVHRATGIYTAISIVLCMFESVTGINSMKPSLFWWFLLFSFVLSVISMITDYLKSKEVHFIIVMVTHFILSYIAFFFIFINGNLFKAYIPDAGNTQNSPFFVGLVYTLAFIGAYFIIFGIKFAWCIFIDKFKGEKE